jgi:hypothetical protein
LRVVAGSAEEKLGVDLDDSEEVVQLVGDVAGDPARFLEVARTLVGRNFMTDFFCFFGRASGFLQRVLCVLLQGSYCRKSNWQRRYQR